MANIDLNQCTQECHNCVLSYIKKHHLKKGATFEVPCKGIPKEYVSDALISISGTDSKMAIAMFDPVTWAAEFLDWHCIDPDGKVWKRKTEEGNLPTGFPEYDEEKAKQGKSSFHRPYQSIILRCTSTRKVMRLGRQLGKSESLCISILYGIFTNKNFKVVLITPYQSQIKIVFDRLNELIKSNQILYNSIKISNKAPNYLLELYNGSSIVGFTAGTRSGQDAGSARGQSAHMLVFDEADMLSPGDIDAALAIITNFPNATVWMSSTPTGRRESFYKTCRDPAFREFHYPSWINPNWTKDLEKLFRSRYTEAGYDHEVAAEFGEQEEGVYKAKYIEAAQQDYEYNNMKFEKDWLYGLGCDWNEPKIGTTIAVVGYNPHVNKLYLVAKHIVSAANRTQLTACDKIVELNRLWNCRFIYVDKGHGTTQAEILREFGYKSYSKYGKNHPDSKLSRIVKEYDFGSSIEIRDLITKQPIKKHAKPFLVENSVRKFEQCMFHYPRSDTDYTAQLQGYIVDKVTDAGRFVYKAQNEQAGDHFLDAVNLALVGFTLEETKLGKIIIDATIQYTPSLNKDKNKNIESRKLLSNTSFSDKPRVSKNQSKRIFNFMNDYSEVSSLPGNIDEKRRLWAWPGFMRDEPKPRARDLNKNFRNKPIRKKF